MFKSKKDAVDSPAAPPKKQRLSGKALALARLHSSGDLKLENSPAQVRRNRQHDLTAGISEDFKELLSLDSNAAFDAVVKLVSLCIAQEKEVGSQCETHANACDALLQYNKIKEQCPRTLEMVRLFAPRSPGFITTLLFPSLLQPFQVCMNTLVLPYGLQKTFHRILQSFGVLTSYSSRLRFRNTVRREAIEIQTTVLQQNIS